MAIDRSDLDGTMPHDDESKLHHWYGNPVTGSLLVGAGFAFGAITVLITLATLAGN